MVGRLTPEAAASSACDIPTRARAALICRTETKGIEMAKSHSDTIGIKN
jgi:hypothetical protein